MNKTVNVGIKLCITLFIILVFFIAKDNFIYRNSDKDENVNYSSVNSYEVIEEDGMTVFTQIGEDPYMIIEKDAILLSGVKLVFADKTSKDMVSQVFFARSGKSFSEENSVTLIIPSGSKEFDFSVPVGKYNLLRLDIDGDYAVDSIICHDITHPTWWALALYLLCLGLVVVFVWWGYKYVVKLINIIGEKADIIIEKRTIRIWRVFLFLGLVYGIIYSVILPPMQVPDEQTHYGFLEQELGLEGVSTGIAKYYNEVAVTTIPRNPSAQVDVGLLFENWNSQFDSEVRIVNKPQILLLRHFPAAIGLVLGLLFHLPISICLLLAEFTAVLFYVICGTYALKIMPVKRELLMVVMLLPMTLQQCASVNYDSTVFPVCFLVFAICMDCIYGSRVMTWKLAAILIFIAAIIAVIKIPYILIYLMFLLVPIEKWKLTIFKINLAKLFRKLWPVWIVMIIGLFVFACYIFRTNIFVQILYTCIVNPKHTLYIIYNTFKVNGKYYLVSLIGQFGWLDCLMPVWFYFFVSGGMLFISMNGEKKDVIKLSHRLIAFLLFFAIIILIVIALLQWNLFLDGYDTASISISQCRKAINGYSVSLGIQGRYFIPVVMLGTLPFSGMINVKKTYSILMQIIFYIIVLNLPIYILLNRYWI